MIVDFGLSLDGLQPAPPATGIGRITAGPMRLLDLLELQLGLPQPDVRPGEALLAYQACLEDLDTPSRFYHASLKVDPLGTARTLLGWRARWHEAGWRGSFDGAVPARLGDMADVETLAAERVPLNLGQRAQRIARALDEGLPTQIERIVLHEEPSMLPDAWRRLLERFACELAAGVSMHGRARPGSDLHALQRFLIALDRAAAADALGDSSESRAARAAQASGAATTPRTIEPIELNGDSSVIVVRGVSRDLSAQLIGEYLRNTAPCDAILIAERDGIIVDNALERVGLPRAGFRHYSRFRAVTQVQKLALSLVWKPIGPRLLLQFLLHPIGPLPRRVRSALAAAVAAAPGTGGRAWQRALEAIAERERAAAAAADPPAQTHARIARLLEEIRYWLECERWSAEEGAPIEMLMERVARGRAWLASRLRGADPAEAELYAAAVGQSEALIDALGRLAARGSARVGRLVLERLVDEVSGHSPDPATFAQAGHVRATTTPDAVTHPWHTVFWGYLAPQPARADYPWSAAELAALRAQGVALPPSEALILARSRAWMRPIVNACERLILVMHDSDEGRHPLWSRLANLVRGFTEIGVERALLGGAERIRGLDVALEPLAVKPLPAKRRWWRLPPEVRVSPRPVESYSSLQKLVYHPHQWLLRYAARLSRGRAANLAEGALLYGNLSHRLIESYFARFPDGRLPDWRGDDEPEARRWLAAALPAIVEREGAVLDEPGMGVARARVLATLENALLALLRHLRQADIARVAAEVWHEVPFGEAADPLRLCGAIDLLLTDRLGREIVLDVKWSGRDRRGAEIAENRALQLAAYAYLRHAAAPRGAWPEQAYFVVKTGEILAADTRIFPEAVAFPPLEAQSAEQIWRRLGRCCEWRWAQLERGEIEVNAEGTEPDRRCVPPEDALPVLVGPDGFDDYAVLTGWEPGA